MRCKNRNRVIKNVDELLLKGNLEGRRVAVEVLEHAIKEVNSYDAVRRILVLEGDNLMVGGIKYKLSRLNNIYVLGAGKATFEIAKALEDTLKEKIFDGVIVAKKGRGKSLRNIRVFEGGHPIPDEDGMFGAIEVAKLAEKAGEGDLVFVAVTGGCSALMSLPAEGLTIEDKQKVTSLLLKCGATIDEINTVRRHISAIKGGKLARMIHPADIVNLIVIDEVANKPWGPTIPDDTTFRDAINILKKHDLWVELPKTVRIHLEKAELKEETPNKKELEAIGLKARTIVLARNVDVCKAASEKARKLGYKASILTTFIEGESREVGVVLSALAREIEASGNPLEPPCIVISGGETTVTISGDAGEGGRNQELALSASLKIAGSSKITIASLGTDGTDGPTEIAGAIVDGYTVCRAKTAGFDVEQEVRKHNSSSIFRALGDAVFTGPTGTNVMDLQLIVVTP